MWSDGSPTDYWSWADGEPNDWRGSPGEEDPSLPGEDCGMIWHQDDKLLTASRFERLRGSWNDAECELPRAFVCETAVSTADSEQPNCVYQAEATLGGFTMDEVYAENSDTMIQLDSIEPGVHIFQGFATQGMGWFGGYWEVMVDGVTVAGGDRAGLVTGPTTFGVFQTFDGTTSVMLKIHAGDVPSSISWVIDQPADASSLPAYSGPRAGVLTLGGNLGERKGYEGSFAGLAILRRPLDDDDADCLYKEGAGSLAVCESGGSGGGSADHVCDAVAA